jgi:cytidylate kinase
MIITIDGPSAAGKGTISKLLAKELQFAYFDTGLIYRAVGLYMHLNNLNIESEKEAEKVAKHLSYNEMLKLANHKDLRSDIGSLSATKVASYTSVRTALLELQKGFANTPVLKNGEKANGVIYDGRDTGTVICPNADLKFFITASSEVRAKRRYNEYIERGLETNFEDILKETIKRDETDKNRKTSPLIPADDAIIIDTSELAIDQVFDECLKLISKNK